MKLALAGEGAFGVKHLEGLQNIPDVSVRMLIGGASEATRAVAERFNIESWTLSLDEALGQSDVDAVILATPTPLHASQAIACLEADKHVQVEIPIADNLHDAERLATIARASGKVAMAGHSRRFNPSHQWIHQRLRSGDLVLQQLLVQTYFMRRSNQNALGQPRSWVDHLLWHHAAHTVDLFGHQTGEPILIARGLQGPIHAELGIALDMSIQMKTAAGAICTLSLSFNNDGPFGSIFHYICDRGTYVARYDELIDGWNRPIDVSRLGPVTGGIELQDLEFITAIRDGRSPRSSIEDVLPAYRVLDAIQKDLL